MVALFTLSRPFENASAAPIVVHAMDPIADGRWDDLVVSHPNSSAFHHSGWLKALALTYGYEPFVLTSSPANQKLTDGIVFCRVRSWITGNRLVSLPFSDHCEPLLDETRDLSEFVDGMLSKGNRRLWKYVELRPVSCCAPSDSPLAESKAYWFHTLDLSPSLEQIFQHLHKNSIQRRIRRAEREQISYETGNSERLLAEFYGLLIMTRRRHRLLPQPRAWFRNLVSCIGQNVVIRVARKEGVPIAAILTLRHRDTVVYKYGCSDERFHNLAGMPFLLWKLIEESKAIGVQQIDFGRTDLDNCGLTVFKDRFGTVRRRLTYFRYPQNVKEKSSHLSVVRDLFSVLPDAVLPWAGGLVYRHLG